jgi:iron complex outermembrane receptor protein
MANTVRSRLLLRLALCALAPAIGLAQTTTFNLPGQPLAESLRAVGAQTNVNVMVSAPLVDGKQAPALKANLSVNEALARLLAGTGLEYHFVNEQTVVIRDKTQAASVADPQTGQSSVSNNPDATKEAGKRSSQDFRVAQTAPAEGSRAVPVKAASESPPLGQPVALEEIVVTANKRTERLIDTALAVSAVNASDLTENGAVRLEDYSATVPGVSISNNAAGGVQTQVVFRGIATGSGGNPVTAVYIDDTPITSATQLGGGGSFPDFDPADLQRVEFLRGPQGTLYGAASLGGLVKYVTRRPDFAEFSGRAELDAASADQGATGGGARLRLNVPLGAAVALTASGFYRRDPGFIDNLLTGQKDINTAYRSGGRMAVAIKPTEDLTIQGSVLQQVIDMDAVATIDTNNSGAPLYRGLQVSRPPGSSRLDSRFTLYDLSINDELDAFEVIADTSYGIQDTTAAVDYTKVIGGLVDTLAGQPAGTSGAVVLQPFTTEKFSQEVRAQSTAPGFLGWQAGAFYTHEHITSSSLVDPVIAQTGDPAPASFGLPNLGEGVIRARYEEVAGFGTLTLNFTPQLSVSGGLRYSYLQLKNDQALTGLLLGSSAQSGSSSDNKLTFSFNPEYKFTPDVMIYGRIASGYRPGGPNIATSDPATYKPDTVVSYEVGTKGEFLDRLLTVDFSGFLINWNDIQVQQTQLGPAGTPINYVGNVGQARSQGVEAAFLVRPREGLTLNANVAYTDAHFTNDTSLARTGDRLPISAKFAGQIGGEYRFDVQPGWTPFFGASFRYVGSRLGELAASPAIPRFVLPSYSTVDLRTGCEHEGFEISIYLRNAADRRGYTGVFGFGPYSTVGVLQPRTVGMSLAKSF